MKVELQTLDSVLVWDAGIPGSSLTHYTTPLALKGFIPNTLQIVLDDQVSLNHQIFLSLLEGSEKSHLRKEEKHQLPAMGFGYLMNHCSRSGDAIVHP